MRADECQLEERRDRVRGGLAHDHRARFGNALDPRRDVGREADRGALAPQSERGRGQDRLPRVHTDARLQIDTDPRAGFGHRPYDVEAGFDRAHLVVLAGDREPEVREHAVALELVEDAAMPCDHLAHDFAVGRDHGEVVLGVETLTQRRGPDDVGEQDGEVTTPLVGRALPAVCLGRGEQRGGLRLTRHDVEHLTGEIGGVVPLTLVDGALRRFEDRRHQTFDAGGPRHDAGPLSRGGGFATVIVVGREQRRDRVDHGRADARGVAHAHPPQRLEVAEPVLGGVVVGRVPVDRLAPDGDVLLEPSADVGPDRIQLLGVRVSHRSAPVRVGTEGRTWPTAAGARS